MSLGKCFDLHGSGIDFGDVDVDIQNQIVKDVYEKFGDDCFVAMFHVDRIGRTKAFFKVGIAEELADEACEFAEGLAKKYDLFFCHVTEVCS